jgi:hypothetical protein
MRSDRAWVVEGLVTGLIGYATVAVFFMAADLVGGAGPFHTPAMLGGALFFGVREVGDVALGALGPAPVIAYNGVHLLASLVIGTGAAWLVFQTERNRPLWYVVFFIFLAGFIYSVVIVGVLAAELTPFLPWSLIVAANVAAGITAGGYLWRRHTGLLNRFAEDMTGEY